MKEMIIKRFLEGKVPGYEITDGEMELINLMEDVINGLLDDKKYLSDNYKRVLNEKLNLEEIVSELRDTIKGMNN